MTLGEYRVGITFNPSSNADVDAIKKAAASLIDDISYIDNKNNDDEVARLKALAMTYVENAAMWAVKAITKPPEK